MRLFKRERERERESRKNAIQNKISAISHVCTERLDVITHFLNKPEVFFFFAFFASIFVLVVAVMRAAISSMTYDETFTYLRMVLPGKVGYILNYHPLNTWLISFFDWISGTRYNEVIIRLPSLVSYCFYLLVSYLVSRKFRFKYLVFTLFAFNYFSNEFFSIGRGYSLAATLILCSCYSFCRWINTKRTLYFYIFAIFASLSLLAQMVSLYIILAIIIYWFIYIIYNKETDKIKIYLPALLVLFIVFCGVAIFTVYVSGPGHPRDSVYSYKLFLSYFVNIFSPNVTIYTLAGCCILSLYLYAIYKNIKSCANKHDNFFMYIFFIYLFLIYAVNLIMGRGYPYSRMTIPVYPLFFLSIAFASNAIRLNVISNYLSLILSFLLIFNFTVSINLFTIREWRKDKYTKNIIYSHVLQDYFANENDIKKFTDFLLSKRNSVTIEFYRDKLKYLGEDKNLKNRLK